MFDWNKIISRVDGMSFPLKCETFEETIRHLQNRIRTALFFFINSSFWFEDAFTIGNIYSVGKPVLNCLSEIQPYIFDLEKKYGYFNKTSIFLKQHGIKFSLNDVATFFSIFYEEFSEITAHLGKEGIREIDKIEVIDMSTYPREDYDYLSPLNSLKNYSETYMKDYLTGFYLHGSLATQDYIRNWSDVDTIMIIKRDTILNPEKILLLRRHTIKSQRFFYQIDPFQLHGHLTISEFDTDYYPEPYFPLVLFNYSKSFWKHKPIYFRIRNSSSERLLIFWTDAVHYFLSKVREFRNNKGRCVLTAREKKLFLHRLMTYPLFYLQAKGEYNYKKFSFVKAQKDFPDSLWSVIDIATDMMKEWPYTYSVNRKLSFISHVNMQTYFFLITRFYNIKGILVDGPLRKFERDYESLLYTSINLAIEGWRNIESEIN